MKQFILSVALSLAYGTAVADVIDLAGAWNYRLDRNEEVILEAIDTDELTRMAREFLDQK